MEEKNERKSNLITIRMDDIEKETLEYLSDHMDRTKSETIIRACKFFAGISDKHENNGELSQEKRRRSHYIHMRVTDSDMEYLNNSSNKLNKTISTYARESIKAYYDSIFGVY